MKISAPDVLGVACFKRAGRRATVNRWLEVRFTVLRSSEGKKGFTLLELMVSMAVLALLLVVTTAILNQATSAWTSTRGKIEQFRQAREAFESVTRQLSQSTLNTYLDYEDAKGQTRTSTNSSSFVAARYARQSDLRFVCGPVLAGSATGTPSRPTHSVFFQAPLGVVDNSSYSGLQNLLNTCGYYIEYADDSKFRPFFVTIPLKSRFRLMELIQPSENMTLYIHTAGNSSYAGKEWFTEALTATGSNEPPVHVLAENVLALVLLPKLTPEEDSTGTLLAPAYSYDSTVTKSVAAINSKNQLPPVIQISMVAIDEATASRLSDADNVEIKSKMAGLFINSSQYSVDLAALEDFLINKRITYRLFTTSVSIKGAKWSREQVN